MKSSLLVSERVFTILLCFLILAVYLLLPCKDFYWDGVSFAIEIEKAAQAPAPLLHPNHLIYNLAGFWLFEAAHALGLSTRALFLLQTLDSLFAAVSVALVYHILRASGAPRENSVALALLFAFSATWWKFATDADAYIASVFFLLCCYSLLISKRSHPGIIAVLHCLAMLFHQLAALFFPAAVYGLYRKHGVRAALRYAAAAFLSTMGVYVLAYRTVLRSGAPVSFLQWITAHSPAVRWRFEIPRDLGLTMLGNVRLFLGGRLSGWNSGWVTRAGLVVLLLILLVAWKRLRVTLGPPAISEAPLWIWAGVYTAFLFFFEPQNTFYRLFYFPAVIFLLGSRLQGMFGLAVAAIVLWNFSFSIYPRSKVESNETLAFALRERSHWPAGSCIVYHTFHPDLWTITYFNRQAYWIGVDTADISRLESYRADFARDGRSLWLEQTMVDLLEARSEGRQWLASHVRAGDDAIRYHSSKRSFAFYLVEH